MSSESDDWDEDWDEDEYEEDQENAGHEDGNQLKRQGSYTILESKDIELSINSLVEDHNELLGVSMDEAYILLSHYCWKPQKLMDAWIDNELKVRVEAGISIPVEGFDYEQSRGMKLGSIPLVKGTQGSCQICFGDIIDKDTLQCGHTFCVECWQDYLSNKVTGAEIKIVCPQYNCQMRVPEEMIDKYIGDNAETKEVYRKVRIDDFIYLNKQYRWCPSPGCTNASDYPNLGVKEIRCRWDFVYCFACGEEAHRPSSCEIIRNWQLKNSAESENVTWILANTKQWPMCRKPIEKNQGCNHMTCRKEAGGCNYEFCWMCMGPWSEHGSNTGGYYQCNKYESEIKNTDSSIVDEENKRADAKTELDKYMFYFERYNNHQNAQKICQKQLPDIEKKMQRLHDEKQYPIGELQFLKEGADQVITCRRILKNTYSFGYFLENGQEKNLFEHLQEKLEENTEHLHELVETDLSKFLDEQDTDRAPFYHYKSDLTNYYQVTKKFLGNLLDGIESGLTATF